MGDLREAESLKKTEPLSPRGHQLPTALHRGRGCVSPSPLHAGASTGFILCKSCTCSPSCELRCAMILSGPEDPVSSSVPTPVSPLPSPTPIPEHSVVGTRHRHLHSGLNALDFLRLSQLCVTPLTAILVGFFKSARGTPNHVNILVRRITQGTTIASTSNNGERSGHGDVGMFFHVR